MKENILYAYHIEVENLHDFKEYSVFQRDGIYYYFTRLKRSVKEFQELLEIMSELRKNNISILEFIPNVEGVFITLVDNVPYVLVKAENPNLEYGIVEIMEFQKKLILNNTKSSLYRNVWANLWSSKVDYFEYQVHELGKNYPIILNSFSYYVGLAETAISYVNHIERTLPMPKNTPIVLSHRRVNYPNLRLNFDNPLNFIFDIEVRDIASFVKSMFFTEPEEAFIDLKAYLNLRKPDAFSLSMLYARLLYPSYYFDLHEKVMNQEEKEECLLPIIDKVNDYELFLKKTWYVMSEYYPLEPIAWILKKES